MTTVIINDRTKEGKALLELIRHMKHAQIIEDRNPTASLLKSIEEAQTGNTNEYNSTEELFSKLGRKTTLTLAAKTPKQP